MIIRMLVMLVLSLACAFAQEETYIVNYSVEEKCPECPFRTLRGCFDNTDDCNIPWKTVEKFLEFKTKEEAVEAVNAIPEVSRAKARVLVARSLPVTREVTEHRKPQPDLVTPETKITVDGIAPKPKPVLEASTSLTDISSNTLVIGSRNGIYNSDGTITIKPLHWDDGPPAEAKKATRKKKSR